MVIEKYKQGKVEEVYKRFEQKGRLMPEGLKYINSWISEDVSTCYQLMETDDIEIFQRWISNWNDLVDFEIIPVITSRQAKEKVCG
ncbi:MAG TPA: DUF3303 family protein [Parafilimonas sp.]|nr:DUF3303 family protein [Parafilimonas sp.]